MNYEEGKPLFRVYQLSSSSLCFPGTLLWLCRNGQWLGLDASWSFSSIPRKPQAKERTCAFSDPLNGICNNDLAALTLPPETTILLQDDNAAGVYQAYLPYNWESDLQFIRQIQLAIKSDLNRCYRMIPDATASELQRCGRQQLSPYLLVDASRAINTSLYINSRRVHLFSSPNSITIYLLPNRALQQPSRLTSLAAMALTAPQQVDFLRPHPKPLLGVHLGDPSFFLQRVPRGERALWFCSGDKLCQQVALHTCHRLVDSDAFGTWTQVLVRPEDGVFRAYLFRSDSTTACWDYVAGRPNTERPQLTLRFNSVASSTVLNGNTYYLRYRY